MQELEIIFLIIVSFEIVILFIHLSRKKINSNPEDI
jgi:hypothetical protein